MPPQAASVCVTARPKRDDEANSSAARKTSGDRSVASTDLVRTSRQSQARQQPPRIVARGHVSAQTVHDLAGRVRFHTSARWSVALSRRSRRGAKRSGRSSRTASAARGRTLSAAALGRRWRMAAARLARAGALGSSSLCSAAGLLEVARSAVARAALLRWAVCSPGMKADVVPRVGFAPRRSSDRRAVSSSSTTRASPTTSTPTRRCASRPPLALADGAAAMRSPSSRRSACATRLPGPSRASPTTLISQLHHALDEAHCARAGPWHLLQAPGGGARAQGQLRPRGPSRPRPARD